MTSSTRPAIVSADLIASLIGITITIWSWFSSAPWPAWPAFGAMAIVFGAHHSFAGLPFSMRAIVTILLIAINVSAWTIVIRSAVWLWRKGASRDG